MFTFLAALTTCLKSEEASDHSETPPLKSCVFCNVSAQSGFKVIWEDETFIAFFDHKPAARHHIQVIPKAHVPSIRSLQKSDAALVKSMERIGHEILDDLAVSASMRRMGFHIPPFNSVNHLHLHVHGLPYASPNKAAKYWTTGGSKRHHKGFSWFAEVGQVIMILENGGRVGVLPC